MIKPGDTISSKKEKGKKVPKDFIKHHKISMREHFGIPQANATEITKALAEYKLGECFCILGVTNVDLYPGDAWNFVYGLANMDKGTGVFSFYRHREEFIDPKTTMPEEEKRHLWLTRAIGIATHEITHMFGIKHCIYYHCSMNGTNGRFEKEIPNTTLCPVCLMKLSMNIKFNIEERYVKLIEASKELGFESKAKLYEEYLAESESYK